MLRFFSRAVGLLLLAGAFAAIIIDGTRSIAGSEVSITPLSLVLHAKIPVIQAFLQKLNPLLWDPVAVDVLRAPIWSALLLIGLLLMWLARRRAPDVGILTRT